MERRVKGETGRKYLEMHGNAGGCKLKGGEEHQRDETRKRPGSRQKSGASWMEPPGGSPADINLIGVRATVRLAVRAAGSVGTRPTVMCG